MTDELAHIMVFKTNVNTTADLMQIKNLFFDLQVVEDWSVDMEDVDRVLRVVSHELNHTDIIIKLTALGFDCCEMDW